MDRTPVHLVRTPAQWMVLMAPVRAEVAETLRLLGPCSIAEIAHTLDRPADTLYRHIDALRKAGFVREVGLRKAGRNAEQVFDVVADDFVIDFQGDALTAENKAIRRTADSFLRAMGRAIRDTAAVNGLHAKADQRNVSINYELSWLTPDRLEEVRTLIRRLKAIMDEGKRSREGRLYMTLAIACPVTRKRGVDDARQPAARPARTKPAAAPAKRRKRAASDTQPPADD